MSIATATLLLPTADASWRMWKNRNSSAGETIETPAQVSAEGKQLVVGLPASACRTVGMILPNADHEVLEQIIMTQLERRGMKLVGGTARNFRWHLLTQTATTATVSVDVLADPFPESLALPQASDYTAALRLVTLPAGHLIVSEEQGSLVLASGYQGRLYHSHLFAQTTARPEEIAQEIILARLTLESELGHGSLNSIALIGSSWEHSVAEQLTALTDLPTRIVTNLPPNADLDSNTWTRLLPTTVRVAQASAARRGKLTRFSLLGALFSVALVFLAFAYLRFQERTAVELTAAVDATEEPASKVKRTVERWKALAPAIEPKRYPMVVLAEITKLMPPSGIVIREFEIKDNEIDMRGDARDAQVAVQFVEDLQKSSVLGRYTWTKPQPTLRDKVAQFRVQGKAQ